MSETKNLEETDLVLLREFASQYNFLTKKYGEVNFQIRLLEADKLTLEQEFDKVEEKRVALMNDLQKKYGQGSVNIETGEFVSA